MISALKGLTPHIRRFSGTLPDMLARNGWTFLQQTSKVLPADTLTGESYFAWHLYPKADASFLGPCDGACALGQGTKHYRSRITGIG